MSGVSGLPSSPHPTYKNKDSMCIALPAKVLKICGQTAEIAINGQVRQVLMAMPSAKEGDWVLLYGNAAIAVIDEQEAQESSILIGQLQEAASKQGF